ncbi:hypothetical protein TNIN_307291 [Trichonephila inaurata madagascariensis]|uniref:Uncharacterized protein n=1 Tax=Trichonephila inaurata madagascariensis TaxID=2747483 RepID=A0A8X6WN47_9ARAC|nr:hypothetical protein TNIN_307291 [Trichonephila inaurata madagascariensis]
MAGTCPLSTGFQVTAVPSLSVQWNCTFHKTGAGFPETVGLEVIIHRRSVCFFAVRYFFQGGLLVIENSFLLFLNGSQKSPVVGNFMIVLKWDES